MNAGSSTFQSSYVEPSIIWPVVMIVVGVLALWVPVASSVGVARLLGWLLVFDAVFQLIHSFRSRGAGHIAWKVLVSVVFLLTGIYFLMHPFLAVAIVTFALAIFFLAEGLIDVFAYFATRGPGLRFGFSAMELSALFWLR